MNSTEKLLLIGLPESGKTTFLAALWYIVDGKRSEATLTLEHLEGDREYLNFIRNKWLACEAIERTRTINEQTTTMSLTNIQNQETIDFKIPDLSGETFRIQWTKRIWSADFQKMILDADGALLFVHPERIIESWRIDQANRLQKEISNDQQDSVVNEISEASEWDPKDTATQVQLVELLQFIEYSQDIRFPFKLAIIISAWDRVMALDLSPVNWLKRRLPLLYQYLRTNAGMFPHEIYGVSAQGGPYPEETSEMSHRDPSKRIVVKGPDVDGNDITVPLAWLMSNNGQK